MTVLLRVCLAACLILVASRGAHAQQQVPAQATPPSAPEQTNPPSPTPPSSAPEQTSPPAQATPPAAPPDYPPPTNPAPEPPSNYAPPASPTPPGNVPPPGYGPPQGYSPPSYPAGYGPPPGAYGPMYYDPSYAIRAELEQVNFEYRAMRRKVGGLALPIALVGGGSAAAAILTGFGAVILKDAKADEASGWDDEFTDEDKQIGRTMIVVGVVAAGAVLAGAALLANRIKRRKRYGAELDALKARRRELLEQLRSLRYGAAATPVRLRF